jgi:hypothetical protein
MLSKLFIILVIVYRFYIGAWDIPVFLDSQ